MPSKLLVNISFITHLQWWHEFESTRTTTDWTFCHQILGAEKGAIGWMTAQLFLFPVCTWVFSTPKHSGRCWSLVTCSMCCEISLSGQGMKMTTHVDLVQRWWIHAFKTCTGTISPLLVPRKQHIPINTSKVITPIRCLRFLKWWWWTLIPSGMLSRVDR